MTDRRSLPALRRWHALARTMLIAMAAIGLVVLFVDLQTGGYIREVIGGAEPSDARAAALDQRARLAALAYLGGYLLTAVAFIRWTYLAYRETGRLAAEPLDHAPGWAIGAWLVPFLNLVRPYRIVKEIVVRNGPPDASVSLVGWWWGAVVVSGVAGRLGSTLMNQATDADGVLTASNVAVAADCLDVVGAVLAILVVGRATALVVGREGMRSHGEGSR